MFNTLRKHSKIIVIIVSIAFVATGALMGFGSYLYGGGSSGGGGNQRKNPNIAKVNNENISQREFLNVLQNQANQVSNLSSSQMIDFRLNVLNSIIERRLILQKAEEKNIRAEVSDSEVQKAIDDILKNYDMTKEELVSNLENQGYSMEDFRNDLRNDLKQSDIIAKTKESTYNNINVSEEEIKEEYDSQKEQESEERKYEEAKSDIKKQLVQEKQEEAFNNWLKNVRTNAKIEINDPLLSGAQAFKNENFEKAVKDFEKVVENQDSVGPGTNIYLARSYKENGNKEKAEEIYKKTVKEYPDNWEVHLKLGDLYRELENTEKALTQYDKASELVGENYRAHYQLYQGYNQVGAEEKAQKHMEKVQQLSQKMLQQQMQNQLPQSSNNNEGAENSQEERNSEENNNAETSQER